MTEQFTTTTGRGPLEWSFEHPDQFKAMQRTAPTLLYPWEVAGMGDWDFPARTAESSESDDLDGPPVDDMPVGNVFLWLVLGDVQRDNAVDPSSWSLPLPYQYMRPSDVADGADPGTRSEMEPLTSNDQIPTRSWSPLMWSRIVPLTDSAGQPEKEPLYLMLRAFAGSRNGNLSAVDSIVTSLRFRYVA